MFLPATPSLLTANRVWLHLGNYSFQICMTTSIKTKKSISAFCGLKICEVDRGVWKFVNYIKEIQLNKWDKGKMIQSYISVWQKYEKWIFVVCFTGFPLLSFKTCMNIWSCFSLIYTETETFHKVLTATVTTVYVVQYVATVLHLDVFSACSSAALHVNLTFVELDSNCAGVFKQSQWLKAHWVTILGFCQSPFNWMEPLMCVNLVEMPAQLY